MGFVRAAEHKMGGLLALIVLFGGVAMAGVGAPIAGVALIAAGVFLHPGIVVTTRRLTELLLFAVLFGVGLLLLA
jgi:hypothetical protein